MTDESDRDKDRDKDAKGYDNEANSMMKIIGGKRHCALIIQANNRLLIAERIERVAVQTQ